MCGVIMINNLNFNSVLNIYEEEIVKNIKNKNKLYRFEKNKVQNISHIVEMLKHGDVGHNHYNIFLIYEPKVRLIMSLSVRDKIINHFITRNILEPRLNIFLNDCNVATRKNMGTDYAIKKLIKYINILKNKYKMFYVLKIDISKYFYNIDHNVLKSLLVDKLSDEEYKLVCKIIDSTNKEYINNIIKNLSDDVPLYKYDKGLPIGNMSSQMLSIFYLYKLDHYIINDLKLKYYIRYMDDFIILCENKEKINKAKIIICNILKEKYLLNVNKKKTFIVKANNYFSFLSYVFKIDGNKTVIRIRKNNFKKIGKRIKEVRYLLDNNMISYNSAFSMVMTYSNSFKYSSNRKRINLIDRYFYYE